MMSAPIVGKTKNNLSPIKGNKSEVIDVNQKLMTPSPKNEW